MTKNILALLVAAGISAGVMAADNAGTAIPANGVITTVAAAGCSLLSEDVVLNLSSGVKGSYACNTALNVVAVAACHPNGRKQGVSVDCDPVPRDATAPGGAYVPPQGCAVKASPTSPNDGSMIVQGGVTYAASSRGGRVQGVQALACTAAGNVNTEVATAAGL
ncbi:hypothetical protein [Pseudomonas paeninsulae]|uniref:hypothetical protein n=1 Tax=Pseudomonas paeninsulae TaxID=3110772 RepID=UPI002D795464|nr:hypothetical protein [Pseudomonas sp. IT1137]